MPSAEAAARQKALRDAEQAAGLIRCTKCGLRVHVTVRAFLAAVPVGGGLRPLTGALSHYSDRGARIECEQGHPLNSVFEVFYDDDDDGSLRIRRRA
jgi:hypothetical protein